MRRVALMYNPISGNGARNRAERIEEVARVLRGEGIAVESIPTEWAGSAGPQTLQAIENGCDTVIACGGDGTIHDVLQSLVGGPVALGIVPMGTANALAADLGIPASPARAARMLLQAAPVRIPVGRVFFRTLDGQDDARYFVVAAGIGADGLFFSHLDSRLKQRFGYLHYTVEAVRLAAVHTFPNFCAEFTGPGRSASRSAEVSQILAVRISNFGGLVQDLVPGAAIDNETLQVLAFKTRSRLDYFRFMAAVWFRRHKYTGAIQQVDCRSLECRDLERSADRLYVEADGELLGTLPVRMEVVPQALTMLVPSGHRTQIAASPTVERVAV